MAETPEQPVLYTWTFFVSVPVAGEHRTSMLGLFVVKYTPRLDPTVHEHDATVRLLYVLDALFF